LAGFFDARKLLGDRELFAISGQDHASNASQTMQH
jgi:hypothetical protein